MIIFSYYNLLDIVYNLLIVYRLFIQNTMVITITLLNKDKIDRTLTINIEIRVFTIINILLRVHIQILIQKDIFIYIYIYIYIYLRSSLEKDNPDQIVIYDQTLRVAHTLVDTTNFKLNLTFHIIC